ncbi:MAG: GNAT family N-acetyltransferase [Bacteroidetes bacterium]|nr:GNAT family N-acetyltransferase [Bacteroidota bacterium]
MVHLCLSQSSADLEGILALQRENLLPALSEEEKAEQGFVTITHTMEQLERMQAIASHVIAKENEQVVGYILAMTLESRTVVPMMATLFDNFEKLQVAGKKVTSYQPMIVGQVCIGKSQRSTGLFEKLYGAYKAQYASTFDFVITSIALSNYRSMSAHQRIGFQFIHRFEDSIQPWSIVFWDWNSNFPQQT